MTAPLSVVIIAALVGLILGAILGMWIADREWLDEHEQERSSRALGRGFPTEEDEGAFVEEWRRRGGL